MGYRLYHKENSVFIAEFTHQHLAEKKAKELGERENFTIEYVKKDECDFSKEIVSLFDRAVNAYEHGFKFMTINRR